MSLLETELMPADPFMADASSAAYGILEDPFATIVREEYGGALHAESLVMSAADIDAEVARFASEINGDADDRFSEADNAFLREHGITSRHMTAEEELQVAVREQAARNALFGEIVMRHQVEILDNEGLAHKKNKRTAFGLAA